MIVRGAILPHAPLLTTSLDGPEGELAGRVVDAMRAVRLSDVDALVALSPHGRFTGIYSSGTCSLRGFGVRAPELEVPVDAGSSRAVARAWDAELSDDPLDHGLVVPLTLVQARVPVVAAALEEGCSAAEAVERGRSFVRALSVLPQRVAFVASVNTGAALTPRAPLGLRAPAVDVDRRLIEHLTTGVGDGNAILSDLAETGGSCGVGPLAAFAEVFAGKVTVHAYEAPVGVGYLVATGEP